MNRRERRTLARRLVSREAASHFARENNVPAGRAAQALRSQVAKNLRGTEVGEHLKGRKARKLRKVADGLSQTETGLLVAQIAE